MRDGDGLEQNGSSEEGEKWSISRYTVKIYLPVFTDRLDMILEGEGERRRGNNEPQEFWLGLGWLVECSEFANIVGDTVNGYIQELDSGMLTLRHLYVNDLHSTSLLNNARYHVHCFIYFY